MRFSMIDLGAVKLAGAGPSVARDLKERLSSGERVYAHIGTGPWQTVKFALDPLRPQNPDGSDAGPHCDPVIALGDGCFMNSRSGGGFFYNSHQILVENPVGWPPAHYALTEDERREVR